MEYHDGYLVIGWGEINRPALIESYSDDELYIILPMDIEPNGKIEKNPKNKDYYQVNDVTSIN